MHAQLSFFPEPVDDGDTLPHAAVTRCKTGDLWAMGQHRLLVDNCTVAANVARLMDGKCTSLLIADPPYGMRLDADFSSMEGSNKKPRENSWHGGNTYTAVIGDNVNYSAVALLSLVANIREQFWFGADYYARSLGDTEHTGTWLVWDKRGGVFDKMFGSSFELLWSRQKHQRHILRYRWAGIFGTEQEPEAKRLHPTQKPMPLIEHIVKTFSKEGDVVLDPYSGSGTTIIACERMKRRCYACEISPHYADIILARWERLTRQTAVLLE